MIRTEREHRITKARVREFEQTLAALKSHPARIPAMHKAQVQAVESQLADLRSEIADYENLRSGGEPVLDVALQDLPRALVRARIGQALTQRALAQRLRLPEQQIQRYEATDFDGVSLGRLLDIVTALGVEIHVRVRRPATPRRPASVPRSRHTARRATMPTPEIPLTVHDDTDERE